jgi:hypothetical protein
MKHHLCTTMALRVVLCFGLSLSLFLGLAITSTVALARTHPKHHYVRHTMHRHGHHSRVVAKNNQLRTAQIHLSHLGYYSGRIDGLMGPKTKTAIKNFQRNRLLPITGKLTVETYNSLVEADANKLAVTALAMPRVDFYATHPDYYGHIDPTYSNPTMLGTPQTVPSRYGNISVDEDNSGSEKRYTISLDGRPLLRTDSQPSAINISRTFNLGAEDAIILSAYRHDDTLCPYEHYVLALTANGSALHPINNCTRGYQAKVNSNSLFIVFPETDDERAVGSTWRYENGEIERL